MKKTTLRSLAFGLAAMLAIVSRAQTIERNMEELFSIADRNNTSIRSCQTAIEKSQQNVEAARSQRLPDVSTSLSVSYIGTGQTLNRDFSYYANPNFPHWGNSFALEAQQVVYAGGALTNGIRLAELGTTMERHNDESNRESVHMLLAGLYLQRMSLINRLAVVEKNVMLADTLIDKTRNRYEEGVVLRNDITRYELMREQMALQKVVIADRIKIVDKQMHTALYGEAPETPTGIEKHSDIDASILSLPMHDEAYWQDMALTENSNLKKATTSVELSKVQEKIARAASLPKVAITAADNLNGPNMINVPALDKNMNYWYVGVGVKYNISSIYKNNKNIRSSKLATKNAVEKLDVAKEGISDAVHAAYVGLQTVRSELKTRQKSMELARQNYDVISNRYNNGLALVTDMTDAANVRLDAELQYVDAQISVVLAYYKLKYAAGNI